MMKTNVVITVLINVFPNILYFSLHGCHGRAAGIDDY
jgi:hypothetical protein